MTGKELLLSALRGEMTERPAWVPYVGVHGGKLIGKRADEYLQSADLIVEGLTEAKRRYRPDGLPIVFDLQLEAEVLGCDLQWSKNTPPTVTSHPLSVMEGEGQTLADLPEFSLDAGRYPIVFEAADKLAATMGDEVALYGLLTGPFTLTSHLLGNDLFLLMFDQPDYVKQVLAHCTAIARTVASGYLEHGADVVAVVDPMTSQISPAHFDQFVKPYVDEIFDHVRAHDGLSSLFVCGDATRNLGAMATTTCDNIAIDEQIPLSHIGALAREHGKSFGGNIKLTAVLLLGNETDAKVDAYTCITTAGDGGFVLAPGCDLPYDVKSQNVEAVAAVALDPYERDVAKKLAETYEMALPRIDLPDYAASPAVRVDVITLDSASCAPCTYMFGAANKAREALHDDVPIDVVEHKITTPDGIAMMVALGVTNLPTICIEGEPRFCSIIPSPQQLQDALVEAGRNKAARTG